ncbi:Flagellar basal-body P-ring formation protein FlgA [Candidatus Rhodobacter oscarellae]|uniref:Flagella basal body P-ring formation protein FlgA n=1 Tax=Candidatus Rhodobacter oscarellae TaxID=1675527 RepID=A0A0J9H0E5_9RHOB|nr:flagellar basal body P-ring formation chaperone FlgA [Candidatus Rhodobacter lobularis]KMW59208.1 Flagellar basal-body P-ring formation protein FlgA [Candidatus Rhodobacter lobularis]
MLRLSCLFALLASSVAAETLVATRTVRAQTLLGPEDVKVIERTIPGMLSHLDEAVGLEARVSLYAGRPIKPEDVGPPAIIERNQIVTLIYRRGGLTIAADARSMARAGVGDSLRVMNLASRSTVTGIVRQDGAVTVGGPDLSLYN